MAAAAETTSHLQVLMVVVILVSHMDGLQFDEVGSEGVPNSGFIRLSGSLRREVYDAIDVFAGEAVLSRMLISAGYATATMDVLHWSAHVDKRMTMGRPVTCKQNPLDLRTAPGFALLDCSLRNPFPTGCLLYDSNSQSS